MTTRSNDISRQLSAIYRLTVVFAWITAVHFTAQSVYGKPFNYITIDGDFSDWADIDPYFDPAAGDLHRGVPDVHDTNSNDPSDPPEAVDHPDVDLREYKFTHDEENLYAYFRSAGQIGATQDSADGNGRGGRYYVIVTIDVDNNDETGYWLHEGGYSPTTDGYDMNMEAEFYNGELNTAHYLSHDALGEEPSDELKQDFVNLTQGGFTPGPGDIEISTNPGPHPVGYVQPASGNYDNYTQWVYHQDDTLTLVEDRGPVVQGIMSIAISPDGHELEMAAPFIGFLNDAAGDPNVRLGKIIDISFSLEASGELASPPGQNGQWASDTGEPILNYLLETYFADISFDGMVGYDDGNKMALNWGAMPGASEDDGDLYDDDIVDARDFTYVVTNWNEPLDSGEPGEASGVPEPSGVAMALLAVLGTFVMLQRSLAINRLKANALRLP